MPENQLFYGYVLFLRVDEGSKNEHFEPFLIQNAKEIFRLFVQTDNPFEHETLQPYHSKWCEIEGVFDAEKNAVLVSKVIETTDPYLMQNAGEPDDEVH